MLVSIYNNEIIFKDYICIKENEYEINRLNNLQLTFCRTIDRHNKRTCPRILNKDLGELIVRNGAQEAWNNEM